MHDYFYGIQSDQFAFIRVPTILFTDDQYRYVSADAKILYGLLLSRMELSAKNGWIDDLGRVFMSASPTNLRSVSETATIMFSMASIQ